MSYVGYGLEAAVAAVWSYRHHGTAVHCRARGTDGESHRNATPRLPSALSKPQFFKRQSFINFLE